MPRRQEEGVEANTRSLDNIDNRIEKLEKRNRFQVFLLIIVSVAIGGAVASQSMSTPDLLETSGLILQDARGKERGRVAVEGKEAFIALSDENQIPRAKLTVNQYGPSLVLYGPDGEVRTNLVAYGKPVLALNDRAGRIRLQLEVEDTGPFVTLYDADENPRALVGVGEGEPLIRLYTADGKVQFSEPQSRE